MKKSITIIKLTDTEKEFLKSVCEELSKQKTISISKVIKFLKNSIYGDANLSRNSKYLMGHLVEWFENSGMDGRFSTSVPVSIIDKWNPILEDVDYDEWDFEDYKRPLR